MASALISAKDLVLQFSLQQAFKGATMVVNEGEKLGLVDDEVLYLKVDEFTQPTFEERGLKPFVIQRRGDPLTLSYNGAPKEALTGSIKIEPWITLAVQAAQRAK